MRGAFLRSSEFYLNCVSYVYLFQHYDIAKIDTCSPLACRLLQVNLDLGGNGLVGQIPTEVAGLPNLLNLQLSLNPLTGTVPSEVLDSGRLRTSSCIS